MHLQFDIHFIGMADSEIRRLKSLMVSRLNHAVSDILNENAKYTSYDGVHTYLITVPEPF